MMFNITAPLLIKKTDAGQTTDRLAPQMITFLKLNIFVWTFLASIVAFNIESIINHVFDPKYLNTKHYIYVWLLLLYSMVIKNVFEPVARALEYAKVYRVTFISGIVNLCGNFILIPAYGIKGAIISSGVAFTLHGYLSSYMTIRKMSLRFNLQPIIRTLAGIFILAVFISIFNLPVQVSLVEILFRNSLLFVIIGIFFWPFNYFSKSERKYIFSFLSEFRKQ